MRRGEGRLTPGCMKILVELVARGKVELEERTVVSGARRDEGKKT